MALSALCCEHMTAVDIYDFVDVRSYLARWLSRPEAPSQRELADAIDVSPALLTGVMKGQKKLVLNRIPAIAAALGLSESESKYFHAMVVLDRADTPAARRAALEQLIGLRRVHESNDITAAMWELYSRWWYPAIAELSACEGFQDDPRWVAKTLVPAVTVDQAREALNRLRAMGMLAGGVPVVWSTEREVRASILGNAMAASMLDLMKIAGKSLASFPQEEVHFTTITFAIDPAKLGDLKQTMQAFITQMGSQLMAGLPKNRRVYQILLQLHPVSGPTAER